MEPIERKSMNLIGNISIQDMTATPTATPTATTSTTTCTSVLYV